jgi:solute:Na+ symporter, SSS family
MGTSFSIPLLDLIVIVAYLVGIVFIGMWSVRKDELTGKVYFLAGRSLKWPVIGSAMFAANISTIHLVGLAESGYKYGVVIGNFEWMATFTLILLALVFAPFYFRSKISTLPEFLETRYSPASRSLVAFMAILSALLIHIGISLYAGAAIFKEFFGINVVASIIIISVVTGIYTIFGGLKAVVVTETIQTVILLLGAVLTTILGILALPKVGIHTFSQFHAAVKPDQLTMLQSHSPVGFNWYAIFLGYPILGIWYWCTDQTIVQRLLGARTERDAQHGALFAGLLKITPVFFMVFPGVIGYVLFKDIIGTDAKLTLPVLIHELVPTGIRGLIAAGMLAALMSTIAAALNSVATLVAVDIVKRVRPATPDQRLVQIGKISAVVVMLLSMAWSTQAGLFGSIFEAINKMPAQFLAPPITTVFLWGVFWRRGTKQASLVTLLFGFIAGFIVFLMDLPLFGKVQLVTEGLGIGFMMQAWWGFCICSLIFVVVSLLTPKPDLQQIEGISWKNPLEVLRYSKGGGLSSPRLLAALILLFMAFLYYILK